MMHTELERDEQRAKRAELLPTHDFVIIAVVLAPFHAGKTNKGKTRKFSAILEMLWCY